MRSTQKGKLSFRAKSRNEHFRFIHTSTPRLAERESKRALSVTLKMTFEEAASTNFITDEIQ